MPASVESLAPDRGGWVVERLRRDAPLAVLDLGVALGSYLLTLVLRFDGSVPTRYWSSFWRFLPLALAIHLLVNQLYGLYGPMWRYASVHEARRIVLAGVVGGTGVVSASVLVGLSAGGLRALPLSVTMFGAVLTLLGAGAVRFQSRLFTATQRGDGGRSERPERPEPRRVLIVGAGSAGAMVLKDILAHSSIGIDPVGIVDDDVRQAGAPTARRPRPRQPLGHPPRWPSDSRSTSRVAIPTGPASGPRCGRPAKRRTSSSGCSRGSRARRRPVRGPRHARPEDRGSPRPQGGRDRPRRGRGLLPGRRVLITGAGGSIGSEIARQVASSSPRRSSSSTTTRRTSTTGHVARRVREQHRIPPRGRPARLKCTRHGPRGHPDRERMFRVFVEHRPEIVFHAAAHKHVPVLEEHPRRPCTNVIGTANVLDAAEATARRASCSSPPTRPSSRPASWARRSGSPSCSSAAARTATRCCARSGSATCWAAVAA